MTFNRLSKKLEGFISYLQMEERSAGTVNQYAREVQIFLLWAGEKKVEKNTVIEYKEKLQAEYKATSVNAKLAAVNSFLMFTGHGELKVRNLKIQRQAYCSKEKELTKAEYIRLINAAKRKNDERLSLLLQTICGTGIRVSELKYITAEAVEASEAQIQLKGKIRTVIIPRKLCKMLKAHMKRRRIRSGPVFVTRTGKPMDRTNIWRAMKQLCETAGVAAGKVFPHNLRHLFARCFYKVNKDIAKLADILGHTNIETTRIYIISTGEEHRRQMETLKLII